MDLYPMSKANLSDNVKKHLLNYIKSMSIKNGTKLPSENEIAQNLSVSRVTIRRALDDLEKEGIVFRIHGRGTFVNPEALQIKANLIPGLEFSKLIEASGYKSRFEIIRFETIPADEKTANILQIEIATPIYVIEKLYYADNHPAIVSIDRFPHSLLEDSIHLENSLNQSIFDILRLKGGKVIARDKIEIESMTTKIMKNFSLCANKIENESVLVFHGINYDQDNHPIIYDTEFYNTNFIRFNLLRVKSVF